MPARLHLYSAVILTALALSACKAPPSVQKVIDENNAEQDAASQVRMVDPVVRAAREDGREVYNRYLLGQWKAGGSCESNLAPWEFTEDSFTRPEERPCRLEVIEALKDGSYAIAGYCPRLQTQDEAEIVIFTRTGADRLIVLGPKGGPLIKC